MDNPAIAAALEDWADVLSLEGASRHHVAAYRRAAAAVASWPQSVARLRDPTVIPGVGDSISARIHALLGDGWPELLEARKRLGLERDILRGDLHTHTHATDGRDSILAMARAAAARGYEYLAITDHSKETSIAGGLDEQEMRAHLDRVRRASDEVDIELLAGAEVDILKDGSLDFPDALLADMDVVVCSVHFRHKLSGPEQTERILRAMSNEHADILAHPTARRGKRPPMDIDVDAIAQAAADQGWSIEVNGSPERLDLRAEQAGTAARAGAMLALDSDAHATAELGNARNALLQARRGGVPDDQVLNALPLQSLRRHLG